MKENSIKNLLSDNMKMLIFLIIIIVLIVVVIVFFGGSNNEYIVLDNKYIIEIENGNYKLVDSSNKGFLKSDLRMFYDNDFLGVYTIDNDTEKDEDDEEIYYKDKDGQNSLIFSSPNIGITKKIAYVNFNEEKMNNGDLAILKNILKIDWVKDVNELSKAKKINLDFNNDGVNETLYIVTYMKAATSTSENEEEEADEEYDYSNPHFSIVFMKIENQVITLRESNSESADVPLIDYDLAYVLDVGKTDKYEIVLSFTDYDIDNYDIFRIDGSNSEFIITTLK